jgi:hypothetical protein
MRWSAGTDRCHLHFVVLQNDAAYELGGTRPGEEHFAVGAPALFRRIPSMSSPLVKAGPVPSAAPWCCSPKPTTSILGVVRRNLGFPERPLLIGLPLTIVLGFLFAAIVFPLFETVEIVMLAPTDAALGKPVVTDQKV